MNSVKPDFNSDYECIGHPIVLDKLVSCRLERNCGYAEDVHCKNATSYIRKECDCPNAEVFYLFGGTQTNAFSISLMLRPWDEVMAADTGHIMTHEAGAVEATGHRVVGLSEKDGLVSLESIHRCVETWSQDPRRMHMVRPRMIYLTQPSEFGTQYSLRELRLIYTWCKDNGILVYIDGARLGYGISSDVADYNLSDIAHCCDAFYIGGTKCGLVFGEALVFPNGFPTEDTFSLLKRYGALIAKGFLSGMQFESVFERDSEGNLPYYEICRQANKCAFRLSQEMAGRGYAEAFKSTTNQRFFIVPRWLQTELVKYVDFSVWNYIDDKSCIIRLVTSWATKDSEVDDFIKILDRISVC